MLNKNLVMKIVSGVLVCSVLSQPFCCVDAKKNFVVNTKNPRDIKIVNKNFEKNGNLYFTGKILLLGVALGTVYKALKPSAKFGTYKEFGDSEGNDFKNCRLNNSIKYYFNEKSGLLVVKGTGNSLLSEDDVKSMCGKEKLKKLAILGGIGVIGESAISVCMELEHVLISNDFTEIRDSAFWDCPKVQSFIVPSNSVIGKDILGYARDGYDNMRIIAITGCGGNGKYESTRKKVRRFHIYDDTIGYRDFSDEVFLNSKDLCEAMGAVNRKLGKTIWGNKLTDKK